MIQIEAIVFNSFQVNTYLVWDETGDCLVVDPALTEETTDVADFKDLMVVRGEWMKIQLTTGDFTPVTQDTAARTITAYCESL